MDLLYLFIGGLSVLRWKRGETFVQLKTKSSFSAPKDKTNLSCVRKSRFLSPGASDCSCWRCGPRARAVKRLTKITSFGKNLPGSAIGSEVCFPLIREVPQLHYMQEHRYLEQGYQRARRALWYSINITATNPARVRVRVGWGCRRAAQRVAARGQKRCLSGV